MEEIITQAFLHVDVIDPHVSAGYYDLVGPDDEIILPTVWDRVVKSGWDVTMHLWPMYKISNRGDVHRPLKLDTNESLTMSGPTMPPAPLTGGIPPCSHPNAHAMPHMYPATREQMQHQRAQELQRHQRARYALMAQQAADIQGMGGVPPGDNPNAHGMQHLTPAQAELFQQHNMNPISMYKPYPPPLGLSQAAHADPLVMGVGNPNIQQLVEQHQRIQELQQQQHARQELMEQQAAAMQDMGEEVPMGIPLTQDVYHAIKEPSKVHPHGESSKGTTAQPTGGTPSTSEMPKPMADGSNVSEKYVYSAGARVIEWIIL